MAKPAFIAAVIVAGAVAVGGGLFLMNQSNSDDSKDTSQQSSDTKMSDTKINDPYNEYSFFSDSSITKAPEKDAVIGGGNAISIEYDGSKTKDLSSLFYTLYYVADNGDVLLLTDSSFTGITKGTFTTSDKVYKSDADGQRGFLKAYYIKLAANDSAAGGESALDSTQITLGMYPITFKIDE